MGRITRQHHSAREWICHICPLVKHYLSELKPNSGSSLNDRVGRVETQIDAIYRLLVTRSYADHPTNRLYEEPDC